MCAMVPIFDGEIEREIATLEAKRARLIERLKNLPKRSGKCTELSVRLRALTSRVLELSLQLGREQ